MKNAGEIQTNLINQWKTSTNLTISPVIGFHSLLKSGIQRCSSQLGTILPIPVRIEKQ